MLRDEVVPGSHWEFDEDVTAAFDDMLERSIPQYREMRRLVANIAAQFADGSGAVVDLGCSRGGAIADLVDRVPGPFVGVEVSESMLEAARQIFADRPDVDIIELDLRSAYPEARASVTLAVLTLQFTPIEYRHRIVESAYRQTVPGGVIILVEKVLGSSGRSNDLLVSEYYELKRQHGYSQEQIDRKRFSLEGVLVPVTAAWNEEMLRRAGFVGVECFWRWSNFAAWVAWRR